MPAWALLLLAWSSICLNAAIATPQVIDYSPVLQLPVLPPEETQGDGYSTKVRPTDGEHEFTLRHIFHHGTHAQPNLHVKLDVTPDTPIWTRSEDSTRRRPPTLRARSRQISVERLQDRHPSVIEPLVAAARLNDGVSTLSPSAWTVDKIPGPNVTDKDTILNLARMAANAYETDPSSAKWQDITYGGFNHSNSFGWEGDGLQGHIFADSTNSTIVMSLKGTTTAVFDGAGTTTNDKVNDNLFFSCCCAQGGQYFWKQVCDCKTTTYTCNQTCVVKALREENHYYRASLDLYANVTALYPDSDVWIVGHSLGGSVGSLLGLTYGLPVVTYEAPPQALAAQRLGLPSPPGSDLKAPQNRKLTGIYHVGHTADPIFMGVCNGVTSVCSIGGYAMETVCHSGERCVYDVVADKGWRSGVGTHRITSVINDVIETYEDVPKCELDEECVDCYNWKYFESNGSTSTTSRSSSTSTTSRTRTNTCQTPGWWGCLDETTTTSSSSSLSSKMTSTSSTTTTCRHYGWFGGCLDPTSTFRSATPAPSIASTSTPTWSRSRTSDCKNPGLFWGCYDRTTTATSGLTSGPSSASLSPSITAPPTMTTTNTVTSRSSSSTCTSPAWFGLICLDPSPDAENAPKSTSTGNWEDL